MVKASDLLADFQRMLREHWSYGSETKTGNVDCSGAFVWSFRQHGAKIAHGSNYIERHEIKQLLPMTKAAPGMAAFKKRVPSDSKYDLPDKYKTGGSEYNGDLNDYYHIGLVNTDGNILNAQSTATGFVSSSPSTWCGCAYLKRVDYSMMSSSETAESSSETAESSAETYTATVVGGSLNVRRKASKTAVRIAQLPEGTSVSVVSTDGDWSKITYYTTHTGYVMNKYLQKDV